MIPNKGKVKKIVKKLTYETRDNLTLEFNSKNYGVAIFGWEDSTTSVKIEAQLKDENDNLNVEELLKIEYDETNNHLTMTTNELPEIKELKLRIKVPIKTKVNFISKNGSLKLKDLQHQQNFNSLNGAIKAKRIEGNIKAETHNGPIYIKDCQGDLEIKTKNSPIKIRIHQGNIMIDSKNSPIKISDSSGKLRINSINGRIKIIEAEFTEAEIQNDNGEIYYSFVEIEKGKFDFNNKKGRTQLILPNSLPYNITARNKLGKFNIGLDGDYDRDKQGNITQIKMVKGGGTVKILTENELGSINLMKESGKSKFINLSGLDDITTDLPENFDKKKIIKKIQKAKKKIKKINIPDITETANKAIEEVSKSLQENDYDISTKKKKAAEKINNLSKLIKEKVKSKSEEELNEQEKNQVNERSRMKILKMLEEGKITSDEAMKLIDALE